MDQPFTIAIFPYGSLAGSVTTTVWVGVLVSCFFNLRFGWVLSGLVVPGYVVPLLLLKPWAAVVILGEAITTYGIVWCYSEVCPRFGLWSGLFGRDRFFALFLVSVLVRVVSETFLLPPLGEYFNTVYALNFDYRNNLHSFGLIVVALLANQFWKPGLIRGLLPALTTISVTFLLVRYVLMEFTNFNLGSLDFLYEDVAKSLLAGPKAYIILLTTAFLASRLNLNYGWEFSGILIPSLLALQWYQPYKLCFTFIETFVILVIGSLALKLPLFRNANVEGARKILFFFNIGFLYHLVVGHLVVEFFPEQKVTDLFGFGYLLTTLLAMRMHDKDIAARVSRATLQTSLMAVAAASVIGFGLTHVPNVLGVRGVSSDPEVALEDLSQVRVVDELRTQKVALYRGQTTQIHEEPLPEELDNFSAAMRSLSAYLRGEDPLRLHNALKLLRRVNYEVSRLDDHHLYIREREPAKGWGTYLVNTRPENELLFEVPAPLEEWGSMEAGANLYVTLKGRALAIAGSHRRSTGRRLPEVLESPASFFKSFQNSFGEGGILQVRSHTTETVRTLTGKRPEPGAYSPPASESVLWVRSELPEALDLSHLRQLVGHFRIDWGRSPWSNILRESAPSGFVELLLNRLGAQSLMFRPGVSAGVLRSDVGDKSIVGYLQDWLLRMKDTLPDKGTDLYVPATVPELLYLDREVLAPLWKTLRDDYKNRGWTERGLADLRSLSALASALGYEVIRYRHVGTGKDYLVLTEKEDAPEKRFWGMYVFRAGPASHYVVQIPRPLSETNVFEYGVMLFERLGARALLVGSSHPLGNRDGSADLIRVENRENLFNLVNQVILRESAESPMVVVQCRAFAYKTDLPSVHADAVVSLKSGITRREVVGRLTARLLALLDRDGIGSAFADGSKNVAGYDIGAIPQAQYVDFSLNKDFVALWLSPVARFHYFQQTENINQNQQFAALGIQTDETDLHEFLQHKELPTISLEGVPDLKQAVSQYMETQDIVLLASMLKQWPRFSYRRIIDTDSKQSFLVILTSTDELVAVANLYPLHKATAMTIRKANLDRRSVSNYIESRTAWLSVKD
ncbi:MAG: poly-gamma-glutamate biosynthesis protein PgsC/CapC [Thermodesulfobacteriota bacterium]